MPKKPLSKRGAERRALQELYATATYSGLKNLLSMGKLDLREVRKYYTDARSKAVKRVSRIAQSDIPWTDEAPVFLKTSELTDSDLLKAVGQVNKFLQGPTTIETRRKAYQELLDDLHEKGLTFLDMSNLSDWDRFREWVRAKGLLKIKYVDGSLLGDLFAASVKAGKANSQYWAEQWEEVKDLLQARKVKGRKRAPGSGAKLNRKRRN